MEARIEITSCKDFPALDWVIHFTNKGQSVSPLLEQLLPLNLTIGMPPGTVMFHHAMGSTAEATDFLPIDQQLEPGHPPINMAPNGGRSSDGVLPFFNMAWPAGGLVWAVGWSGQWSQQIQRRKDGQVDIRAGQQTLCAKLNPGESIRTPRILLLSWSGDDRMRGHNLLRRLLLAHYVPRRNGEIVMPPVTQNMWWALDLGNGTTEENQLQNMRALPALGGEAWWLDAGWFEGGWPSGAGSWVPNVQHFPRGLKPLGDEAHKLGLKFLVWFEPERVYHASRIAKEHPEFVLGWEKGKSNKGMYSVCNPSSPVCDGLFNLGDPAALTWMTDQLSKSISDGGIDIYRTDFNIPPLPYWQQTDEPDRQGITENHYITGLYALWDELLKRHPGLVFDDCASGGRRIDLELISRAYVLSRSDSVGSPDSTPAWDQAQTAGLSLYVPVNATLSTCGLDPNCSRQPISLYALRSAATSGFSISQTTSAKDFSADLFKKLIAEVKLLRPLHNGDFYPLTAINVNNDSWCAWQHDLPEKGEGFAMFFRRFQSPYPALDVQFHGVNPQAHYEVTFVDSAKTQNLTGADMMKLRIEIPEAPGSALVTYKKVSP